jgi:hypothetical protein
MLKNFKLLILISFVLTGCLTPKEKIKYRIEKNWNVPEDSKKLINCNIILHMTLNPDGTIKQLDYKDSHFSVKEEKICKSIVQSTINSVLKSSPFDNLPKERYDDWKEISLLFDSRVY